MKSNAEFTRQILNSRGYIRIPSHGMSMAPIMKTGDIFQFEPVSDFRQLKAGDIVLYESHRGELIGHRYIGTLTRNGETMIVCKGDFNRNPDPPITLAQVIGKMKTRSLKMRLWGYLVVHFPFLSLGIQKLYRKGRQG